MDIQEAKAGESAVRLVLFVLRCGHSNGLLNRVINIFRKLLIEPGIFVKEDSYIIADVKKFAEEIVDDVPLAKKLLHSIDRVRPLHTLLLHRSSDTLVNSIILVVCIVSLQPE
jgi:hypothetical protein